MKYIDIPISTPSPATISTDGGSLCGKSRKRTNRGRVAQNLTHPKIVQKLKDMPANYRRTYRDAMSGNSLRAAVKAFCVECVCYQRDEVTLCTAADCPLYRPYQKREDA